MCSLANLLPHLNHSERFKALLHTLKESKEVYLSTLHGAAKAYITAGLSDAIEKSILIILPKEDDAELFYEDLLNFTQVFLFPALSCDESSLYREKVGERFNVLNKLLRGERKLTLVTHAQALIQGVIPQETLKNCILSLSLNQKIDMEHLIQLAVKAGYERVDLVERAGDFSVRGGLIDIFPPSEQSPVRIEFFGDRIDSIRRFDPTTQRSISHIGEIDILPAKEIIGTGNLLDYLPCELLVVLDNFTQIEKRDELIELIKEKQTLHLSTVETSAQEIKLGVKSNQVFPRKFSAFTKQLQSFRESGYKIVLTSPYEGQIDRLKELLKGEGNLLSSINIVNASLSKGFQFDEITLVIITEEEIFGYREGRRRKLREEESIPISSFAELSEGDFVVHANYGIGRYLGLRSIEAEGKKGDYLLIEYGGGDKLYVPVEQFNLVERYIGSDEAPPKISKLSAASWREVKNRVKRSIRDMAKELLNLYALRKTIRGFAFSPDCAWQYEFEAGFPYEETHDQFKAIKEIKKDMEKEQPMDRLVCGDVGYGKTEVAIRAAFKCVMDSKQVAVLVPTTVLAQQHFNTFKERLKLFPIKVELLSRFKTRREQRQIVEELKKGIVDIVIGTHRLLQRDIQFKDLGLLIIDEEQRFGVRDKEKLKQLRKMVDVLTLTATPIPRTLYMALTGIRDISIIDVPLPGRLPVQTFLYKFDNLVIRDAILREIDRGGQVFFVHNRIETIHLMQKRLEEIVPEARVAIAHGQMPERELERVMIKFLEGKYDVLLSTSIIESGLDMPNVNTIIINDAHKFGLSQLYQLRGRVGRSTRKAYAYLLYPHGALSDSAKRRLQAIKEFTDLGSGFRVAMRDLEIRGAGNILGPEQHGALSSVGFDLYCKLLSQTIAELRGEEFEEEVTPRINLKYEAYIPTTYIQDAKQRFSIYKKMTLAESEEDLHKVKEELRDRYGVFPDEVRRLFNLMSIRWIAKRLRIPSIETLNHTLMVEIPERLILKLKEHHKAKVNPSAPNQLLLPWSEEGEEEAVQFLKEFLLELLHN